MTFQSINAFVLTGLVLSIFLEPSAVGSDQGADEPSTPAHIYGQGVRETKWLSPAQEQSGFHLPTGFEIQLFASEPQIAKPMNMAFDARGRLWVTSTIEYPYQATSDRPARDSVRILEDSDGDGNADKVTTFADGLNIPIGILPVDDGAICFSIPNIWHLRDRDGDDLCDERIRLLGPFDTTRDTHGMLNAFRRGQDGWIYACHGFNNQSQVTAHDGSSVKLISGNTLRFRADGSRVEQFTIGQVNPFGMAQDEWGHWYTADCHSKPLSFLLQGGCYPSFGRPHDGMGFVPDMMSHSHGSTAICGLVYVTEPSFPEMFRQRFFSGNVMTSRINCNRIERHGATVKAIEMPDFLTSDDPWFRPVDLQIGPDGAMYVADFYNKIIGHYEVPLTHPERDRESGRIWRIVYRVDRAAPNLVTTPKQPIPEHLDDAFFDRLGSDNETVRRLTLDRLTAGALSNQHFKELSARLRNQDTRQQVRLSCWWALHRAKKLDVEQVLMGLRSDLIALQAGALRGVADGAPSSGEVLATVRELIKSEESQVVLAAASALASVGEASDIKLLLAIRGAVPASDPVMRHALNLAARALLARPDNLEGILSSWSFAAKTERPDASTVAGEAAVSIGLADPMAIEVARLLPAIPSPRAAEGLLAFIDRNPQTSRELLDVAAEYACRNLPMDSIDNLLSLIARTNTDNLSRQSELAARVTATIRSRGLDLPESIRGFVRDLVLQSAQAIELQLTSDTAPIQWRETSGRAWQPQKRACEDNVADALLASSHALGESYTGVWETAPFDCPNQLSFWIAGHNGHPKSNNPEKNRVVLVDAAEGRQLQVAFPPRSDVATKVEWNLQGLSGRQVRLRCIDEDNRDAYAWLAVGRFSDVRLGSPTSLAQLEHLASLVRLEIVTAPKSLLLGLVENPRLSEGAKIQLMSAIAQGSGHGTLSKLIDLASKQDRFLISNKLLQFEQLRENELGLAIPVAKSLTLVQQREFARSLLGDAPGRELLQHLVEHGHLALESIRGRAFLLPSRGDEPAAKKLADLIARADAQPDAANDNAARRLEKLKLEKMPLDGADIEQGRAFFEKQCAVCHQLAGRGQLVGPQLDGVGARGWERLAEDLLLPNRNVDVAFRASTLLLDNGKVVVGLVRQRADGTLDVTGNDGKTVQISAGSIIEKRETARSLMPENFADTVSEAELKALLGYLEKHASQRPK